MAFHEWYQENITTESRRTLEFAPHFHSALECVLMINGTAQAQVESQNCILHAGDILLTFPNQVHSYTADSPDEESIIIIAPIDLCGDFRALFRKCIPDSNRIPAKKVPPQVDLLVREIQYVTGPFADEIRKGYWLAILGELLSKMDFCAANENDVLRRILNYCMEHIDSDLQLEKVAAEVHVGKYYVSHLFQEKMGLGFHEYVNILRINEASRLLYATSLPITDVSYRTGFGCTRTFNRIFQKYMECTPREYRQCHKRSVL